ncbi:hypothetical protein LSTR_LSTR012048 [Laodelphax striatellus]|uniref:Transcription termination factor 3, mitochondrial n=1 Tax=Laodelphax striatellus TaxID=195883 RepID=A0A482WRU1_LAOST|nr:hypothetical protein LSTR_LSTR012048 [Laodelphax striatellus]
MKQVQLFSQLGYHLLQSCKTKSITSVNHGLQYNFSPVTQIFRFSAVSSSNTPKDIIKRKDDVFVESIEEPIDVEASKKLIDVSDYAPALLPSYNLAAYVDKSPTLQEFVKLGVKLYKFDAKMNIMKYILTLDFEKDVKNHLFFLVDKGVPEDSLGRFITKNPYIFKESLDNLQVRINYLLSKKFPPEEVSRIITREPFWLSRSTQAIDRRLGFFQKFFNLTGDEVRFLTGKRPKLITHNLDAIKVNTFSFKEEMGFNDIEVKSILLDTPKLFTKDRNELVEQFDYVHNVMKLSHDTILKNVILLGNRKFRTEQRHRFLESLGRAQYDPKLPQYVSPSSLTLGDDLEFCQNVAKASVESFNLFLKTL